MNERQEQLATLKIGTISERYPEKGKVKVIFEDLDGLETDELPLVFPKTLKDHYYAIPDIGEHVVCVLDNHFETGVVIGALYDQLTPPPIVDGDLDYILYENGTTIKINRMNGNIDIHTPGSVNISSAAEVNIEATKVTIDAPTVHMTGHLTVANGISSQKGGQGIVSAGDILVTGDVVANDISLTQHRHTGVQTGGGTTGTPV